MATKTTRAPSLQGQTRIGQALEEQNEILNEIIAQNTRVTSVNGQTGNVVLTKNDLSLGNVDNTSDLNKPISIATQAAIDEKEYALYNYEGTDLTEKFAAEIANYSSVWKWLKARLVNHNVSGIHIKDYIPVTCTNGYVIKPQVAGINPYLRYTDQELTAWHIDFISKNLWADKHVWNRANYNNGLSSDAHPYLCSDLKHWLNSESGSVPNGTGANPATVSVDYSSTGVLDKLPAALRNAITPKRVMLSSRYTSGSLLTDDTGWGWADLGKLWVPSEMEVYGTCVWGTKGRSQGCFTQYPIFYDQKMRIKGLGDGGRCGWWLLNPASGDSISVSAVTYAGTAFATVATDSYIGAPVCFRI